MGVIKKHKGFTLIELLVVIAIIAILAAILFPVFATVKEKGRQTKCLNNMKQIGFAMGRYIDDWNNATPLPCVTGCPWNDNTWRQTLGKLYLKSKGVFLCPSVTHDITNSETVRWMNATPPLSKFDHYGLAAGFTHNDGHKYGVNDGKKYCAVIPPSGTSGFGYNYMTKVQVPSKTIIIAENKDGDWSVEPSRGRGDDPSRGAFYPYHLRRNNSNTNNPSDPNYASGGGNFVFCDFHVKFMDINIAEGPYENGDYSNYYWKLDKI